MSYSISLKEFIEKISYNKNQTYTKEEVLAEIAKINLLIIVETLPENETEIFRNKIYLVLNNKDIEGNRYDLYVYVNDRWEQIDSLEFNIEDYPTNSELTLKLSLKADINHGHDNVTETEDGFMSYEDKIKLNTIEASTVNPKDVSLTSNSIGTSTHYSREDHIHKHPTGHSKTGNPTSNQTPSFGSSFTVTQFTSNATGHISGSTDRTVTIPDKLSNTASAVKNVVVTDNSDKLSVVSTLDGGKITDETITSSKIRNGTILNEDLSDATIETGKIKDSAITTAKINDSAVTTGKINNSAVTTDKIKDNAITTGKINNGAVTNDKLASDSVTSDKIANGTIVNDDIKNATITGGKLVNSTVTATQLASDSVTTVKIKDGNVTNDKLASDSVTSDKIANGTIVNDDIKNATITGAKLVNGTVTATQLASNSVTTDKISNGNVTLAKLNSDVYDTTTGGTDGSSKLITSNAVFDGLSTKANSSDVYKKTETLNTTEINNAITTGVSNINLFEVVTSLPTSNIKGNKFYLTRNTTNLDKNLYDIYIYVNNKWEKIDSLEFNISDYIKKIANNTNIVLANGNNISQSTFAIQNHKSSNTTYGVGDSSNYGHLKLDTSLNDNGSNPVTGSAIKTYVDTKFNGIVEGTVDLSAISNAHNHDERYLKTGNGTVSFSNLNSSSIGGSSDTSSSKLVACNDTRLSNSRNPLFTQITADETNIKDLNTYRTGGFFYCGNDNQSKYIIHCPNSNGTSTPYTNNKSFFLLVETWGASNNNYVKQTLTYYNDNKTYTRTKTGNADANTNWKDWVELSKDTDTTYTPASATPLIDNYNGSVGTGTKYAREDHRHPIFDYIDGGTAGESGYVKTIQLKITGGYQDVPIKLEVYQRQSTQNSNVFIRFNNNSSTDPTVGSIYHTGSNNSGFWLYKESTSTYSLIIKKAGTEAHDSIRLKIINANSGIVISNVNSQLGSLPSNTSTNPLVQSTYMGFTIDEKNKLAGISSGANNYTHPSSHPTTFISNDQKYNNIKSGESSSLTLTTQKLINDNINSTLGNKVDKVSGKGLSTNDFTATYKTNLDNLVSSSATTKNAHVHGNITSDGKVTTTTTNVSRVLVTDGDVVKSISKLPSSSVTHQDISGKENSSNKVTSISSSSTDTQYPSAKAVYGYAQPKGNYLTSHNPVDTSLSTTSTNAVQNKVINTALGNKENSSNKVTSVSSSSTDTQYPSAKAMYTALNNKINTSAIKNDLTTGGATNVLSAEQGKTLQNNKLDTVETKNTTNGSAIAEIKANTTVKGTVYHPKVLSSAVSSGLYKITVNTDGHITGTASVGESDLPLSNYTKKTDGANQITDSQSNIYTNLGLSSSNQTQRTINTAINTKIGTLQPKLSNSSWELVSNMNATNYYTNLRVYVNKYLRLGVAQIDSKDGNNCSLGAGNNFNFKIGSEIVSLQNNTVPSDSTILLSPLATSYGLCHNTGKFVAKIDKDTGYVTLYNHSSSTDIEVHGSVYFRF